jgi:glycosyltransferase involved in cell wall biosynthesis
MPALVSILIPVYNARPWVGRAIESALQQTWDDKEIIALDDGSTDGSWEVLQSWQSRIRIEKAPQNRGQNATRNALTHMSRGEWLVYLDADDELEPDSVAQKMRFSPDADAIYGTVEMRHYEGEKVTGSREIRAEKLADPLAGAFLWKFPNTSSFMFRRVALDEVGGWNENIQNCTDYDLYFRLLLAGKRLAPAPESRTVYRQWSPTQAVYENLLRRSTTWLQVMWRPVLQLETEGRLTPAIKQAFGDAALRVIRTIHQFDRGRALEEHRKLRRWNQTLTPSPDQFSAGYRRGYRLLGFRGAEWLASLTRFLRPTPPQDVSTHTASGR